MFSRAIAEKQGRHIRLGAICDSNPVRLDAYREMLETEYRLPSVRCYDAGAFDAMLDTANTVIVCTPDNIHEQYICRSLAAGRDVIVEKPIAINVEQCRRILQSVYAAKDRKVKVTFNCRFMPWAIQIKKLIQAGTIGEIIHAELDWSLDVRKGVTYFSRWHSRKEISGGLIIHKASHHLDLLNWLLDAVPEYVQAQGRRAFFGAENKHKHGIGQVADFYFDADGKAGDPFALNSPDLEKNREKWLAAAGIDGYRPDSSVWRENINIEDTMNVMVQCTNAMTYCYSLTAFSPRIGKRLTLHGTKGRIDFCSEEFKGATTQPLPPGATPAAYPREELIVHPFFSAPYVLPVDKGEGNHEGADDPMLDYLFDDVPPPEGMNQVAGAEQGVLSTLVGAAANLCFESRQTINIFELCPELTRQTKLSDYKK